MITSTWPLTLLVAVISIEFEPPPGGRGGAGGGNMQLHPCPRTLAPRCLYSNLFFPILRLAGPGVPRVGEPSGCGGWELAGCAISKGLAPRSSAPTLAPSSAAARPPAVARTSNNWEQIVNRSKNKKSVGISSKFGKMIRNEQN